MLDFSDLKTGEMVTMGRQAVSSCARRLDEISDRSGETVPQSGSAQGSLEIAKAKHAIG